MYELSYVSGKGEKTAVWSSGEDKCRGVISRWGHTSYEGSHGFASVFSNALISGAATSKHHLAGRGLLQICVAWSAVCNLSEGKETGPPWHTLKDS